MARVGGLAFLLTLLILTTVRGNTLAHLTLLEMVGIISMGLVGLLDDLTDLRARWKAGLGLVIAVALSLGAYQHLAPAAKPIQIFMFTIPFLGWTAFPLLALMFWPLPQAFNLIDGANGLATGFGLVVVGSLWVYGVPHPLMGGALLACLVLNWPRARLFLGDCGSLSIGLLLVVVAQKCLLSVEPNRMIWLFAYPIVDVIMVIYIRQRNHRPIFLGDRNHIHFQIMDRWPRFTPLTVPLLLAISALCGSEIYLQGAWSVLPYLSLFGLFGMACFLAVTSIPERRTTAGEFATIPKAARSQTALQAK